MFILFRAVCATYYLGKKVDGKKFWELTKCIPITSSHFQQFRKKWSGPANMWDRLAIFVTRENFTCRFSVAKTRKIFCTLPENALWSFLHIVGRTGTWKARHPTTCARISQLIRRSSLRFGGDDKQSLLKWPRGYFPSSASGFVKVSTFFFLQTSRCGPVRFLRCGIAKGTIASGTDCRFGRLPPSTVTPEMTILSAPIFATCKYLKCWTIPRNCPAWTEPKNISVQSRRTTGHHRTSSDPNQLSNFHCH